MQHPALKWIPAFENNDVKKKKKGRNIKHGAGPYALPARERWGSITGTRWSLSSLSWRKWLRWVMNVCVVSSLSWLLIYGQWWEAAQRDWSGCDHRNHGKRYARWGWGTFSSMMSALCNPMLWQHKAGRLWLPGGMIIKEMTEVSNASKGRREQWVRMKKQIKTAWEEDDSIQVSMRLEDNAAISIKIKKTSPLWPRNSIFRLFLLFSYR